jgi:hypothetical protein
MPGNVDHTPSYATATELPSELVGKILDQTVAEHLRLPMADLKRGLSAYSLTCRHWAEVIRPILFNSITLRQPEDIMQLLDFLDSGVSVGPALSRCITSLTLHIRPSAIEAVGAEPCLHHYCRLRKRLSALRSTEMSITDDDQSVTPFGRLKGRALLSMLSSSLPRTLPGAVFPVGILTLSGLRLRSVADLVHTVDSLRTVRHCSVTGLSFVEDATRPRPLVHRRTARLGTVYVSGCGDGSVKSQLELCSMIARARERLGYDVDTWASIHAVMLTVPGGHLSVSAMLLPDYMVDFEVIVPEDTHVTCSTWFAFSRSHTGRSAEITVGLKGRYRRPPGEQLAFDAKSPLPLLDWDRLEDTILRTDALIGVIYIMLSCLDPVYFERLLILVKEGKMLGRLHSSERHNVILRYSLEEPLWKVWQVGLEDVVASVPQTVDVDGQMVELDPLEQFRLWQRCDDDKKTYLRERLARATN